MSGRDDRLRVAAVSGGRNVPSARFRVRQYVRALRREGVDVRELVPAMSKYPPPQPWVRPFWFAGLAATRLAHAARTWSADVTLLQREMISTLHTFEGMTRRPRVFDVDDAIWLRRRGPTADRVAELSDAVICGNEYLAEHYRRLNAHVHVLPTGVDTHRWRPAERPDEGPPTIGWTGTSSNFANLHLLEPALEQVMRHLPESRLLIVADRAPALPRLDPSRVEFVRWSPEVEVEMVQRMSVGLMPLEETPWTLGKCAFKMLLYMSAGVPVVASPVGMNVEVLGRGEVGLPATDERSWVDALDLLLRDPDLRRRMGRNGRAIVERTYSIDVLAPRLAGILREVAAGA